MTLAVRRAAVCRTTGTWVPMAVENRPSRRSLRAPAGSRVHPSGQTPSVTTAPRTTVPLGPAARSPSARASTQAARHCDAKQSPAVATLPDAKNGWLRTSTQGRERRNTALRSTGVWGPGAAGTPEACRRRSPGPGSTTDDDSVCGVGLLQSGLPVHPHSIHRSHHGLGAAQRHAPAGKREAPGSSGSLSALVR